MVLPQVGAAQQAADVATQVPANKEAAKTQAEFLAKNVPAAPLPVGSPRLDVLRSRAADLQKQQAAFLNDVATGKAIPFPDVAAARPQHEKFLSALAQSLTELSAEDDAKKREVLSHSLFTALQPVGPFLEWADYVNGYQNVLSAQQLAEFRRLEFAWEAAVLPHPAQTPPLSVVSPAQVYTLTNLSVPLLVQGPPNSTILFCAQNGGIFSNDLPIIEIETGDDGLATAYWITKGDAIADCSVDIRSASAPTDGASFNITTVKLVLRPLVAVSR